MTYTSKSPPNSTSKSSTSSVAKKNSKHNKSQEKETIQTNNSNKNNSSHLNEISNHNNNNNNTENKQITSSALHSHNQSTSNPTSRKSSTASMEYRYFQQQSGHMYSLSSGSNNYRQSSRPSSPTSHRRPSGSVADGESIFFGRASSPIAYDDYDINDPIKEPDSK